MAFIRNRLARDAREASAASGTVNLRQVLAAADRARDARRWSDAATLYRQYLAQRTENAAIWVQLGHALKESGNFGEAESSYKKSIALAPDVADTHLQLGHLLKMRRNFSDAIAAYREAARLDDTLIAAQLELSEFATGSADLPEARQVAATHRSRTFIDLTGLSDREAQPDLFHVRPVEIQLVAAIAALPPEDRAGVLFIMAADDPPGYVAIDDALVGELVGRAIRDKASHAMPGGISSAATSRGQRCEPTPGDVLLTLGEFWTSETITERIIGLGRNGLRIVALVEDVTPITHPEFCDKDFVESFSAGLSSVLRVTDLLFCLSHFAARTITDFAIDADCAAPSLRVLRPAPTLLREPEPQPRLTAAVARLSKEKYVLYEAPLTARKNHAYLLRIWKRLLDSFGNSTPKLVFVGLPGSQGEEQSSRTRTPMGNLGGQVIELSDASRAERAMLYQSALFTVFPSVAEGWAGPVVESLAQGRPCVAARAGSVPEIGDDLVEYVDPFNDDDGHAKILRLLEDQEYLDLSVSKIHDSFHPRQWRDVAADALGVIDSFRGAWGGAAKNVAAPRVVPGRGRRLGHQDDVAGFVRTGGSAFVQFACGGPWEAVENFGRWLGGRSGTLAFATESGGNEPILLMLEIVTVPWLGPMQLRVNVNGRNYPDIGLAAGVRRFLLLHCETADGQVVVELGALGEIVAGFDRREHLWVGMAAIGFAPRADPLARIMLLEEVMAGISNLITIGPARVSYRNDPRAWPRYEEPAEEEAAAEMPAEE